ncbi:MAG TPA: HD domain-containing phosphohydrolase [Candidatus Dormibacteraeota bacterium]|nr:HD domain-containing phosphohydrolase [Candidatus Dormibacteraeota bacterium]
MSADPPLSGTANVGGGGNSVTVLVADDNDVVLRLCRRVLEKAGYKVLTASDGPEALSLALANSLDRILQDEHHPESPRPDMMLLDDAMPGMDSLWAMRQIKKQRPRIAIVIMSVNPTASDRERFLAAGADDVLIKPIRLGDLVAVVAKLTANRVRQKKDVTGTRFGSHEIVKRPGGGGMGAVPTEPYPFAGSGVKEPHALPTAEAEVQRQTILKVQTLDLAMQMLDARDPYTVWHSTRVSEMAGHLGEQLGLGHREVELLRTAGLLHDLGMIGVGDHILKKGGRLSEEERDVMRRHPEIGADLIARHAALAEVAPLVRHHHERWDGGGYPLGLNGEVIPFGARILSVAESFAEITGPRLALSSSMSPIDAVEDISERANRWYDPNVVDALREIHELKPLKV